MRLVVFTGNPNLRESAWWPVVARPEVSSILICCQVPPGDLRSVLRRLRRNIRKHGPLFVPYRVALLAASPLRRKRASVHLPARELPVEQLVTGSLHDPEVLRAVRDWKPDLGLSLGAPILRPALFGIPARGTINIHSGRVPDYRGAPPGFWELVTGAREIGATIHWVAEGLDTGDVITESRAPIYERDRLEDVEARAAELAREELGRALAMLAAGPVAGTPQPSGGTTYRLPTLAQRARLHARISLAHLGRSLAPRAVVKALAIGAALHVVRPLRDIARTVARRHPVRIFTFHRVSELCRDGMSVRPGEFVRQVEYIARTHDVVTMDEALRALAERRRLQRPMAVITFDDAYRSVHEQAFPVLRSLGLPATCFASTDLVGTERRFEHDAESPVRRHLDVMTWEQLRELQDAGWTIAGHTATHARLSECRGERLARELREPVRALAERLGIAEPVMSYPFGLAGDIDDAARREVVHAGYRACLDDFGGENIAPVDPFRIGRIEIGGDHAPLAWRARVHGIDLESFGRRFPAPVLAAPASRSVSA